ncbi:MAG: response regulator [Planctomycetes bacterium]|nr:response regulator [Planctomycetota bacterium]
MGVVTSRPSLATVLLVEDDEDIAHALRIVLSHEGYDVSHMVRGEQALAAAGERDHDLILLDLGLPGMHGIKILHELRMLRCSTPVLVITAAADDHAEECAQRLGAVRFLRKPIAPGALVQHVGQVLRGIEQPSESWRE